MDAAAICIVTVHFLCNRCVHIHVHNIPAKFGDNKNRNTFTKVQMAATTKSTMLNFGYLAFSTPCILYQSCNIPTRPKFSIH